MNADHLKQVYQYTLLLAAEGDWDERELSPIHLLKYAYLADLTYAIYNGGKTFTETNWTFHNFGPWSNGAYQIIENAVTEIGAEKRTFSGDFAKEGVRYKLNYASDDLHRKVREVQENLPLELRGILQKSVRQFKSNTQMLLHAVYATIPMINAAPGEVLDFQSVVQDPPAIYQAQEEGVFVPLMDRLSNKKRKQIPQRVKQYREQLHERFEAKKTRAASAYAVKIDHDDEAVLNWVDSLSGGYLPSEPMTVSFDQNVWKSDSRKGGGMGWRHILRIACNILLVIIGGLRIREAT